MTQRDDHRISSKFDKIFTIIRSTDKITDKIESIIVFFESQTIVKITGSNGTFFMSLYKEYFAVSSSF